MEIRLMHTLKVILSPNRSQACTALKSKRIAHCVLRFGPTAPKLDTPLACASCFRESAQLYTYPSREY